MSKVVIVTGSSGGIGSEVCHVLTRAGYQTVGIDKSPSKWTQFAWDLRQPAPDQLRTKLDFGGVSAIVHCAAHQPTTSIFDTSRQDWLDAFAVNVLALDFLTKHFLESLRAARGTVLAISSVHSSSTSESMSAYAASKAALNSWVRSAAIEYGPEICTLGIALGAVDTPKLREGLERWPAEERDRHLENLLDRTPIRRLGSAAEVGQWVKVLISPDARYASGSVIPVDGGVSARLSSE